jgi:hypothetical protein
MPLFHANENKHKISKESPPGYVSPCSYAETCEINPKHEYLNPKQIQNSNDKCSKHWELIPE